MVYVYTQINTAGNLIAGRESRPGETIYQDPTTGKYTNFPIEGYARTYDPYLSAGGRHEPIYRSSSDVTYTSPGDIAQFQQPASKTTSIPDPATGAKLNIKTDPYGNVLGVTATRDGEQLSQQEAAKVAKNVLAAQAVPSPETAVAKPVPVSLISPRPGEYGYHGTAERPGGIVQPIIPKLPETPRATTEAFMARMESGRPIVSPRPETPYTPSRIEKLLGFTEPPVRTGQTDIFGAERVRPGRLMYPGKEETIPMKVFAGAKAVSGIGLGLGFGEAFTTSSMLRGAKLIQPGDIAAAQRGAKSFFPKMPSSGVAEFIRSEEATGQLLRKRRVTQIQLLERPSAEKEKPVEVIDISKAVIQPREKPVETISISKAVIQPREKEYMRHAQVPYISPKGTMAGSIEVSVARMRSRYVSKPSAALPIEEQKSILTEAFGELQKPVSVTQAKPFAAFKPVSVSIAAQQPISKSLAVTKAATKQVAISKSIALQKAVPVAIETGIAKQIAKQRAIQIPKEIGRTRQITPQIAAQKAVAPTVPSLVAKPISKSMQPPKEISKQVRPPRILGEPGVKRIIKEPRVPKPSFEKGTRKRGKKAFFKFGEYAGIATSAQILGATSQKKPKLSILRKKRR